MNLNGSNIVQNKPHGIGAYGRKGRPWPLPVDNSGRK